MTDESAKRHRPRRWWLRLLLLAIAVVLAFLAITAAHIVAAASQQDVPHADAIVVFGAAEYSGRPSPVLKARLDHALDLFHRGVAPVVITTGGAASDPKFSEGGVGKDYLMRHGVPERSLIAETQGRDTSESATRVGVIMPRSSLLRSPSGIARSTSRQPMCLGSTRWPLRNYPDPTRCRSHRSRLPGPASRHRRRGGQL